MTYQYSFKPTWITLALLLGVFPALLNLGHWQWGRMKEKQQLLDHQEKYIQALPIPLRAYMLEEELTPRRFPECQPLLVQAPQLQHGIILLENQLQNHQPGVRVFQTIDISTQQMPPDDAQSKSVVPWILLDRGWFPRNAHLEQTLSMLPFLPESLLAYVHWPSHGLKLSDKPYSLPIRWPLPVQWIDTQDLAQVLGHPLAPFVIQTHRPLAKMPIMPEKHLSYAIQWFLLSVICFGYGLMLSIKRDRTA